jgi:hypothetical protein
MANELLKATVELSVTTTILKLQEFLPEILFGYEYDEYIGILNENGYSATDLFKIVDGEFNEDLNNSDSATDPTKKNPYQLAVIDLAGRCLFDKNFVKKIKNLVYKEIAKTLS